MNDWLVILDSYSDSPKIVMESNDFQECIDTCNCLVKIYNEDYSVWLKDEWEKE